MALSIESLLQELERGSGLQEFQQEKQRQRAGGGQVDGRVCYYA